jgi:hypothetical protein
MSTTAEHLTTSKNVGEIEPAEQYAARLAAFRKRVEQARVTVASYIPKEVSLVEGLIAERRDEARREAE